MIKSIEQSGGFRAHLDATKELHRGFGYRMWRTLRLAGLNTTALAKAFNVSFITAKDWKARDDAEIKAKRDADEKAIEEMRT